MSKDVVSEFGLECIAQGKTHWFKMYCREGSADEMRWLRENTFPISEEYCLEPVGMEYEAALVGEIIACNVQRALTPPEKALVAYCEIYVQGSENEL